MIEGDLASSGSMTLTKKILKHLGALEVGPFVVFPLENGNWKVEGIEDHREMAEVPSLKEALTFVETYLED